MKITLFNDGWNNWRDLKTIAEAANQPEVQVLKQLKDLYKEGQIDRMDVTHWKLKTSQ